MNDPENSTRSATDPSPRLPETLRLGSVHLTVSGLDRSVDFYENSIGLRLHRREGGVAAMGVGGENLLVLYEEPGARRAGRHAGLYHYALLLPSREELARGGAAGGHGDRGARWQSTCAGPMGMADLFITPGGLAAGGPLRV